MCDRLRAGGPLCRRRVEHRLRGRRSAETTACKPTGVLCMFTRTADGERRADMQLMATRIGLRIATCMLAVAAVTGTPPASADPDVTLPTMELTGGGPIIGVGDEDAQRRIALQLFSLDNPDVEQADGRDAAEFITTAAASISPRLASAF